MIVKNNDSVSSEFYDYVREKNGEERFIYDVNKKTYDIVFTNNSLIKSQCKMRNFAEVNQELFSSYILDGLSPLIGQAITTEVIRIGADPSSIDESIQDGVLQITYKGE